MEDEAAALVPDEEEAFIHILPVEVQVEVLGAAVPAEEAKAAALEIEDRQEEDLEDRDTDRDMVRDMDRDMDQDHQECQDHREHQEEHIMDAEAVAVPELLYMHLYS